MQQVLFHPARRLVLGFLVLSSVLTGCGGGGGSGSAAVPLPVSPSAGGSALGGGAAARLLGSLSKAGQPWLAMVDADSGRFSLTGVSPQTNTVLAKQPAFKPHGVSHFSPRYSRFSHIRGTINPLQRDPGRYLLWGNRMQTKPATSATYAMAGPWSCVGCGASHDVFEQQASGSLKVDFDSGAAALALAGEGLQLETAVRLGSSGVLSLENASTVQLQMDGKALAVHHGAIHGGLFGPAAEEAGLLYGFRSTDGKTISGAALGARD